MNEPPDFVVYNMPGMLSRRVTKQDPNDPRIWATDEDWCARVREKMAVLFSFYVNHGLMINPNALRNVEKIVVRLHDFSELGQKFIQSGASDRWLASFDKPGSKKDIHDVKYLEKQLATLDIR